MNNRKKDTMKKSPENNVRRSVVVSKPDAAIKVERFSLTRAESNDLSVNQRLSDIKVPEKKAA